MIAMIGRTSSIVGFGPNALTDGNVYRLVSPT
jgi:hypothetical protein